MNKSFSSVINRLAQFSRAYYRNLVFQGLLSCATILIVFFITICLIEYFSFLNPSFRKILFWTYLFIMGVLILKLIGEPLFNLIRVIKTPEENQRVAKLIGKHFPEIEDKLINILELNLIDSSSRELINASIEKKYTDIKSFSFQNAIDWKKTIRYLKLSMFPIFILLIIFFSGNTQIIAQASNRLINYNTHFARPNPFDFEIQNSKLETLEKSNFDLNVRVSGKKTPQEIYINYGGEDFKMIANGNGEFTHKFYSVENDIFFKLFHEKIYSTEYKLSALPIPILNEMSVVVRAPKHTKIGVKEYENIGVLKVPEGSLVKWGLKTKNTNQLSFMINDSIIILKPDSTRSCLIEQKVFESSAYSISVSNEYSSFKDSLHYNIDVIKDAFPSISIEEFFDSISPKQKLIKGVIQDDYGFSNLFFTALIKNPENDTIIKEKIKINRNSTNQTFFKTLNMSKMPIQPGGELKYFFTIYDNDRVNNYKKTKSQSIEFKSPSKKEVLIKIDEENKKIERELEEQLNSMETLSKQLEDIEKSLVEEEKLDWQGKQKVKNLLQNYQSLEKTLKELESKIQNNQKERNEVQKLSEKLLNKQKQLQELFQKIMPEEMKNLFKELENSMENIDKKELQEKIQQLKLSNEDVEKELDRNLELLKQFEFDQKLEEILEELNSLQKKEEDLSKNSLEKDADLQKIKEKQQENITDFENFKENFKELKKLKKDLNNKNPLNTEKEEEGIQKAMENSLNQLEKKKKRQASKSQKLSSEKLGSLKKQLEKQKQEESIEQQMENIETLRQILENLIFFSKSEESLMLKMSDLDSNDPQYVELMHKQGDLRNDARVIEDSLFSLSKRIPQISATVNREINIIQEKTDEAIDYFRERDTFKGTGKQQYIMTSANNLAVLLGDILEQIQKDLSSELPSSQECQKPGNGKPKPGELKKMQQELQDHMEKMRKGKKEGQSDEGFSKELVEMLAKQEKIRLALKEFEGSLEKNTDVKNLKEALEKMEKTEQDIANKNITIETLIRQKQIISKLLELDGALREQGESEERESIEGADYINNEEEIILKYELLKSYQKELLKTSPPSLTNYYKEKVNEYFNSLIKEDL